MLGLGKSGLAPGCYTTRHGRDVCDRPFDFCVRKCVFGVEFKRGEKEIPRALQKRREMEISFCFRAKKSRKLAAGKKLFMAPDFFGSTLSHLMCYYARSKYGPLYKKRSTIQFRRHDKYLLLRGWLSLLPPDFLLELRNGEFFVPPLFGARTVICDFILSNIAPKEEEEGPLPPPSDGGASRVLPG